MLVDTKLPKASGMWCVPFFKLSDMFGHFPRNSAGASFLFQGFFLRSVFKFWSMGATLMRIRTLNLTLGKFFFEFLWRNVLSENCTLHFGPENVVHVCKMDFDFGGFIFWNPQLNCLEFFNKVTEPLPPVFFGFLLG